MRSSSLPIGVVDRLSALLLGLGSLAPFGLSWKFLIAAAVVEWHRRLGRGGPLAVPLGGVFLFAFVLSRVYLSPVNGAQVWAVGLLGLLSYFVAYSLSSDGWDRCRLAVLSIVAGTTAHALLNASTIVRDYGFEPSTRLFDDVWTGTFWTATGQATLWVPVIGTIPYLLFAGRRRATILLGWVLLGVSLLAAAVLASRTLLGLTLISLVLGATVAVTRRGRLARLVATVFWAFALIAVAYFSVPKSLIENLPIVRRLTSGQPDLGDDPRMERWILYLNNMWDSPSGGRELQQSVGYAHNMWLDTFDADGVIPFILLVLFSVSFMASMWGGYKRLPPSTGGAILLIGVGVTWMIQAATEPLIDLSPSFFAAGCGFAGATAGVLRAPRREGLQGGAVAHADPSPNIRRAPLVMHPLRAPDWREGGA